MSNGTRALFAMCIAIAGFATASRAAKPADARPLKIGIIGAGKIGGTLATLWVKAGHEVLISSRHPDELQGLARSLGPKARVGTPREAAVFGDVVLISVPYAALPQIGKDLEKELKGKVVIDTGNPYPERDGRRGATQGHRRRFGGVPARRSPRTRIQRDQLSEPAERGAPGRRARGHSNRRGRLPGPGHHGSSGARRRVRTRGRRAPRESEIIRRWLARLHAAAHGTGAPRSSRNVNAASCWFKRLDLVRR